MLFYPGVLRGKTSWAFVYSHYCSDLYGLGYAKSGSHPVLTRTDCQPAIDKFFDSSTLAESADCRLHHLQLIYSEHSPASLSTCTSYLRTLHLPRRSYTAASSARHTYTCYKKKLQTDPSTASRPTLSGIYRQASERALDTSAVRQPIVQGAHRSCLGA